VRSQNPKKEKLKKEKKELEAVDDTFQVTCGVEFFFLRFASKVMMNK
jgi:hypothetical protein